MTKKKGAKPKSMACAVCGRPTSDHTAAELAAGCKREQTNAMIAERSRPIERREGA